MNSTHQTDKILKRLGPTQRPWGGGTSTLPLPLFSKHPRIAHQNWIKTLQIFSRRAGQYFPRVPENGRIITLNPPSSGTPGKCRPLKIFDFFLEGMPPSLVLEWYYFNSNEIVSKFPSSD